MVLVNDSKVGGTIIISILFYYFLGVKNLKPNYLQFKC